VKQCFTDALCSNKNGSNRNTIQFTKKTTSYGIGKMYLLYIFPPELHTYDFVVLTSLTHPRKILLVVLQTGKYETGKAKYLSAPYVFITLKHH
jgi:hypothetical protein